MIKVGTKVRMLQDNIWKQVTFWHKGDEAIVVEPPVATFRGEYWGQFDESHQYRIQYLGKEGLNFEEVKDV